MTEQKDEIRLKELLSVFGEDRQKEIIEILHRDQIRYHQEQLFLSGVMRSDCEIEGIVEQNKDYVLGFYTGDELKEYLSNNYA